MFLAEKKNERMVKKVLDKIYKEEHGKTLLDDLTKKDEKSSDEEIEVTYTEIFFSPKYKRSTLVGTVLAIS